MSETRVFADGYCGVFQNQEDFLKCLNNIGRNSFWERKTSKNLRLVAITSGSKVEEELKQMYADEGLDEDIITDTIINTGLLLKIRNQYYPVRDCAIKSILDRAGISGAGLRRVEKSVYARILNDCLKVAKGDALLRISEGKVSAVLGGDCHDYAVLDMEQVFLDILIDDTDIDRIIRGEKTDFVEDVVRIVEDMTRTFVNDILGTLRERGLDLKAGCVVFIGGGALLLRKYLEQSGKIGRCIFVEDICANAKGYGMLYQIQKKGR